MRTALAFVAAVWTAAVTAALFLPANLVAPWVRGSDTVLHGVLFAVSAALLAAAFPRRRWQVGLALLGLAAASELGQGALLPGRGAEWADLGADVVGIAVGLALAAVGDRLTRRTDAASPPQAGDSPPRV